MKEPEQKTSASGNEYTKLVVMVDPATGVAPTWWNVTVMKDLGEVLPNGLLEKFRYVQFIGVGTPNKEFKKNDGTTGVTHELLARAVSMQDGSFLRPASKREPGEDGDF